jgi:hypothetical protein
MVSKSAKPVRFSKPAATIPSFYAGGIKPVSLKAA